MASAAQATGTRSPTTSDACAQTRARRRSAAAARRTDRDDPHGRPAGALPAEQGPDRGQPGRVRDDGAAGRAHAGAPLPRKLGRDRLRPDRDHDVADRRPGHAGRTGAVRVHPARDGPRLPQRHRGRGVLPVRPDAGRARPGLLPGVRRAAGRGHARPRGDEAGRCCATASCRARMAEIAHRPGCGGTPAAQLSSAVRDRRSG